MTPEPATSTELAGLRAEAAHLRRVNQELLATVAELRATVERQQAHIDRLVRMTFGRRSERVAGPALFDSLPDPEPTPPAAADAPTSPEPPTESAAPRRRGHGRRPRPTDLPRERVEIDLTEAEKACPCCQRLRIRIGVDVSERLDYRPASLFVRQVVRPTYACRFCERAGDDPQFVQPPLPPEPIPRGTAAAGLLAHILVSKYIDHLPLYRQESILARLGWEVTRSTLCDQVLACAGVLEPLYRLMCDRVRASASLHADDTPITLLAPLRTAHAWVYVGDAANPYTVFPPPRRPRGGGTRPNSFGAARNESLRHARGKWVLWLDADDRLDEENRKQLKALLDGLGDERDAYAMKVRSVLDARRTSFRLLDQVRLFRNLPSIRWDYRIHEQILPAVNRAGGVRWADVIVDHVGYQDAGARRGKLDRNLRLLEMDFAERPEDAFTLFNLGWTLLDLGRTEEALTHLRAALEKTSPSSSTLRKLYHLLALAYRALDRKEEALATCAEGLERFPLDAELLLEEGLLRRDQGDLRGAESSWLSLLEARRGQYFASEEVGLRGFRTRQLLAEVYRAEDRRLEAEVQWRAALAERPDFEPAWMGLAELYLRGQRWAELEYFLQDLENRGTDEAKVGWLRARGQVQRGEMATARRTLAAAERALREVLRIDPDHAETRHNLAVLQRRLGRQAAA